jgi:rhodanese-related sulfurtransferase
MRHIVLQSLIVGFGASQLLGGHMEGQTPAGIRDAVLGETGQPTAEISTAELDRALADGRTTVLDSRPQAEFAIGHIPGAQNVAPKPGVPPSAYVSDVAEIGRLLHEQRAAPIVLYCNGPHCGKSKRLATELVSAGYTHVRRYQLGIPVWRALGGVCQIEGDGLRYVLGHDQTAVVIDVRPAAEFAAGSLPAARNIARDLVLPGKDTGEVRRAKDDGRLPMKDHNTRIIVVGRNAGDARYVAEALTREAFHNVAYFPGTFAEAKALAASSDPAIRTPAARPAPR